MPRIFVEQLSIGADSIDLNGHVNNQEYVRWMQDVATAHSSAQGWNMARYLAAGVTWVIRSHFIEYLRPAFQGDELLVATWVAGMEAQSSPRRYRFVRARDGKTLVEAETRWVFCDVQSGRPRDIPPEVAGAFPLVTDAAEIQAAMNAARGLQADDQPRG
ncbi:MAG: acyl-CoA thioesterase [Azonexus sp.]|nr:acyl-CoA thioesterase [Azonexus sp.]